MKHVIIVIDMQNDFMNENTLPIVPKIAEMLKQCTMLDEYVILFTKDTHDDNYFNTQEGKKFPVTHCIQGTKGWDIVSELKPYVNLPGTTTVRKTKFGSLQLPIIIRELVKEKDFDITLCGVCTDICVVTNAMILKTFFPEVTINIMEAMCAGTTEKCHKAAIDTMRSCQFEIIG